MGPDGQELFYQPPSGQLMRVPVQTTPTFAPGNAELALEGRYETSGRVRQHQISPDGTRFLRIKPGAGTTTDDPLAGLVRIYVVQNWTQELLERVPVP